jgi:hypothetical protein
MAMVLITALLFGQTPSPAVPSYRFSSGGTALDIPVELVANGLVFVRANVNDHPGWFILDNATQGFLVDRSFARGIMLQSGGSAMTRGDGSKVIEAGIARDVRIGLPGLELTHRPLVMVDLKSLEPAVGHEVDGIIGSRLFDDFVVAIDYEHRTCAVYSPQNYQPAGKGEAFSVRIDQHGFQFIDATIALPGVEPMTANFLIDGGANTFADLYKPFSEAHHLPPPGMKVLDEPGTSADATTHARDGRADRISIGSYSITKPPITFGQDTEGLMAAKDYAGLIGTEFLERFHVVFDNPGKRLWLTPNSRYQEPAEYDQSGLRLRAEGPGFHTFVVNRIVPQSPALAAGIEPGDILESIDGRNAKEMTLTELRSMLCQPNGRYSVRVLRGGRRVSTVLRLRPLL